MADKIRPVADSPMDEEPSTVATPEGDNEFAPDQPLTGAKNAVDGLQVPRGSEGDSYKKDKS
jgi:hypothetical protein